jgi:hypothetical protein
MSDQEHRGAFGERALLPDANSSSRPAATEAELKRRIEERVYHGIRELRVERTEGVLIVSGRTDRYYLVQLAFAAAQELFPQEEVHMKIAVGTPHGPCGGEPPATEGSSPWESPNRS